MVLELEMDKMPRTSLLGWPAEPSLVPTLPAVLGCAVSAYSEDGLKAIRYGTGTVFVSSETNHIQR
jgi:hypothetical protein